MAVTIREIMRIEGVQERMNLLAGHGGVERVVSFITVMEAPDFYEWMSGGEFVLTTWYAFSRQPELQVNAFTELAKRGIAGIGIKVNRFIDSVPLEILKVADEYQLPVFSITRETKFRELNQIISAELNNFQTNILLEVEKNYKQLVESALSENGFEPLLRSFGRKHHCSCACLTSDCKMLGIYKCVSYADKNIILEKAIACVKNNKQIDHSVRAPDYYIFPCVARGYSLGYLILLTSEDLDEKSTIIAQQLTTFLTLKLLDRIETEQKLLHDLLENILQENGQNEIDLLKKLKQLGIPIENQFRILIVAGIGKAMTSNAMPMIRECAFRVKSLLKNAILIEKHDRIIALVADTASDQDVRKLIWLKPLTEYAKVHAKQIVIGIGPSVSAVTRLKNSYEVAERLTDIAVMQEIHGVMYFQDHMVQTYLLQGIHAPEVNYIRQQIVGRLQEYDNRYGTDLFETMRQVIFVSSLEHMASLLHVHVNTIRYRMKKIREITGLDFFLASDRYILTTAVIIDSFVRKNL